MGTFACLLVGATAAAGYEELACNRGYFKLSFFFLFYFGFPFLFFLFTQNPSQPTDSDVAPGSGGGWLPHVPPILPQVSQQYYCFFSWFLYKM